MSAVRLPRPAALATVLVLLVVAIVAFPRQAYGQVGGRVINPNGVTPTASRVLVTMKGPDGENTRPVVAGRFTFPAVPNGAKVTLQAMAQGLLSAPVSATAPDTLVILILRPAGAQKFNIVPQGAQARTRPATQPPAQPAAPATPGATTAAVNEQPLLSSRLLSSRLLSSLRPRRRSRRPPHRRPPHRRPRSRPRRSSRRRPSRGTRRASRLWTHSSRPRSW